MRDLSAAAWDAAGLLLVGALAACAFAAWQTAVALAVTSALAGVVSIIAGIE